MAMAMARTASVRCRAAHTQLYEVLKVDIAATPAQLKTAYRNLAKNHHPDVSTHPDAHDRFIELSSAYEVNLILSISKTKQKKIEKNAPMISVCRSGSA